MTGVGARFSPAAAPPRLVVGWSSTELRRSAPHKPPTASPYGQKPQRRRISAGAKDPRPAATASTRTRGSPPPPPARGRRLDHRRHETPWRHPSESAAATPPPQTPFGTGGPLPSWPEPTAAAVGRDKGEGLVDRGRIPWRRPGGRHEGRGARRDWIRWTQSKYSLVIY
jgi:hypothetical protein